MNNNPLSEDVIRKRFNDAGYEKEVEEIQRRDKIKSNYCENNSIELLRLSYLDFKDEEQYKKILANKFTTDRD